MSSYFASYFVYKSLRTPGIKHFCLWTLLEQAEHQLHPQTLRGISASIGVSMFTSAVGQTFRPQLLHLLLRGVEKAAKTSKTMGAMIPSSRL